MKQDSDDNDTVRLSRRSLLAGAGIALTGGCMSTVQSTASRDREEQVTLSVKTLPADADPRATRIARTLVTNLKQVGVDARVVPMSREELFRDVLLDHSFDIYVAQHPGHTDPDFLRPLTHSTFDVEAGWQNPFGYADLDLDDVLDRQTTLNESARTGPLGRIQRNLVRNQPFSVVAFPETIRATRAGRFDFPSNLPIHSLPWYLSVEPTASAAVDNAGTSQNATAEPQTDTAADEADEAVTELRMTLTDARPTENLNPLAVEFRCPDSLTTLLYDPLARYVDDDLVPWLAESVDVLEHDNGSAVAHVQLREDLRWHDDTPLTAEDVAFTYEFMQDTSLGELSTPVPTPRFRGQTSLISDIEVTSDRNLRVEFGAISKTVAEQAFTVPVLPKHVWADKTRKATLSGLSTSQSLTRALVWSNPNPVGSGPFQFESSTVKQSVTFTAFEDHFLTRDEVAGPAGRFGAVSFDRLTFKLVPSSGATVKLLERGEADATASSLLPDEIPSIGRADDLSLHVARSDQFYHVGYNVRRAPLGNPRFRRAVARLLDKQDLVDDVFHGYATPAASPLAGSNVVPSMLRWDGKDPELPFAGSEGELDVEDARDAFRDAGYRYTKDDRLLGG